jgi:predicted methyltransferase
VIAVFYRSLKQYIMNSSEEYDILARVTQHPDRPRPIREIDQIFMLPGSQLNQAKLISSYARSKEVVFVGDGDCMAPSIGLLAREGVIDGPMHMTVLDFDRRIVDFATRMALQFGFQDKIDAYDYNVLDPTPTDMRFRYDLFYTNPPYGSKNKGASSIGFLMRCMALCKPVGSSGVAILPYHPSEKWSRDAMYSIQRFMIESGYLVGEMLRGMHSYHLDDLPMLRSATVIFDRVEPLPTPALDLDLPKSITDYFYGSANIPIPNGIDLRGQLIFETRNGTNS